jgi:hypothetical protein
MWQMQKGRLIYSTAVGNVLTLLAAFGAALVASCSRVHQPFTLACNAADGNDAAKMMSTS